MRLLLQASGFQVTSTSDAETLLALSLPGALLGSERPTHTHTREQRGGHSLQLIHSIHSAGRKDAGFSWNWIGLEQRGWREHHPHQPAPAPAQGGVTIHQQVSVVQLRLSPSRFASNIHCRMNAALVTLLAKRCSKLHTDDVKSLVSTGEKNHKREKNNYLSTTED